MIWTSPISGLSVKIKFHPFVEPGKMLKVHEFPFEPEVHFCSDEKYKVVFCLFDSFEEAFPSIMIVARESLNEILNKY